MPRLLRFVALLLLVAGSAVHAQTPPTLTVNASSGNYSISPYIYGINFADETFAADIDLPVNRWGGNTTTRYNWQTNIANHANDWYFENIWEMDPPPATLPDGSNSDLFVEQNKRTGTESLIVIPMIGWTPRPDQSTRILCGFSVAKYGAQQSTDPWSADCGNGRYPNGTEIAGNDPLDTSVAVGPSFATDWMEHLEKYGTASTGGVRFYNLDNEPSLWNETHRDVYPEPLSYDGLRDRTYAYASAIKAQDPNAQTLGPVEYGWTAYFYSALDWEAGGAWWNDPIDQNAHGGVPLVAWYLQQMQAYEQENGVRLLDYLDLHYYPSQPGVSLQPAGNAETQALRLRSTRSLWDPSYIDESWIGTDVGEAVYLIPRMQGWIDDNYPGTKLAITEYNFGGLEHINGALAQADVLGLFGREGVDLATIWGMCAPDEPGAFAFRMYRNYDGAGSKFGETGVTASSSAQGKLSVYAAKRSSDGALTIIVINKTGNSQTSALNLSGFNPADTAQVYRYSEANLNAVQQLANQSVSASGFTATYPANSITLFEIAPASTSETPTSTSLPPTNTNVPPTATSTNVNPTATATELPAGRTQLLQNGGFEVTSTPNQPANWNTQNTSKDRIKCDTEAALAAFRGTCAYRFQGRPDEDARLSQIPDLTEYTFAMNDTLSASVHYRTNAVAPRLRLRVRVFYTNTSFEIGKSNNVITALAESYTLFNANSVVLADSDVERIKLQFWNRATTGKIYLDDASLILTESGS